MRKDSILEYETKMWEAAKNKNLKEFLSLVSEDAVMVCGGYRCTGKQYSEIISEFDCKTYLIENFEIVNEDNNSVQVHYIIHLEVNNERNADLAGDFHITSTWKRIADKMMVVFNMDQRFVR